MITAARECGIMKKIALWFISRKITAGHPYTFLLMVAIASFVLGALVTNTYSLLIICPILLSVCERLNYKRGDSFYLSVFLLALWSVLGGANALPFAKTIFLSMDAAASRIRYIDQLRKDNGVWRTCRFALVPDRDPGHKVCDPSGFLKLHEL